MGKTKVKAAVKVAAKNAVRQKREVAAKKRRTTRRKSRLLKRKDAKDQHQKNPDGRQKEEEEEDIEDLMDMVDPEYRIQPAVAEGSSNDSRRQAGEAAGNSIEAQYEGKRQKMEVESKEKALLPIKTASGLVQRTYVNEEPENEGEEESPEDEDENISEEEKRAKLAAAEAEYRVKLGNWSMLLVEDPEIHVEHLKHILGVLSDRRPNVTNKLRSWAVLSLREVFLDIIPEYRVSEHNLDAKKIKKDTLRLWKYENQLLSGYKSFLSKLETYSGFLKQHKSHETPSKPKLRELFQLAVIAVKCMQDLLLRHPHFNFAGNLSKIIVNLASHPHEEIGPPSIRTLTSLFRQDNVGEISLQAVKYMYALAKRKNYQLPSRIFDPLLALRIHHVKTEEEIRAEMQRKMIEQKGFNKRSRKDRKRKMLEDEVKRDLELTQAEESAEKKQKFQTETLNVVFTIYFRVLKSRPNPKLLTACLEGLAKYAHLINLDFFPDLVNVLHNLAAKALDEGDSDEEMDFDDESSDSGLGDDSASGGIGHRLNPWQALHCVRTAFSVVSGQGRSLAIEPVRFYALLYNALLAVDASTSEKDQLTSTETCIVALTERRKTLSLIRCLAFCKRLLTMAAHQTHPVALAYLNICRILMMTQKSALSLVEVSEEGPAGKGLFNAAAKDPEHAMAQTAIGWELAALQRHYHPTVAQFAKHLAFGCPPSGKGSLPPELAKLDVLEIHGQYSMGDGSRFRPQIVGHPLGQSKPSKDKRHTWRHPELQKASESLLMSNQDSPKFFLTK